MTKKKDKTPEKKEPVKNDKKYTLLELVETSDKHYPSLIMDLHRAGLLEQYEEEKAAKGRLDIEPTITQAEFDKILGE